MTQYQTVGSGTYGYVVMPGIREECLTDEESFASQAEEESPSSICSDLSLPSYPSPQSFSKSSPLPKSSDVSKLFFNGREARIEQVNAQILESEIDPQGHFTPQMLNYGRIGIEKAKEIIQNAQQNGDRALKGMCLEEGLSTVSFITYKHGGENLDSYFSKTQQLVYFEDLLPGLMNILRGLEKMHESGYAHSDIKPKNIVFSQEDKGKMMLVDFGSMVHYDDFDGFLDSGMIDAVYPYYPPECVLFSFTSKSKGLCEEKFSSRVQKQYNGRRITFITPSEVHHLYEQFSSFTENIELKFGSSQKNGGERVLNAYRSLDLLSDDIETVSSYPSYFDAFSLGFSIHEIFNNALKSGRVRDEDWCRKVILPIAYRMCNPHLNQRYNIHQACEACSQVSALMDSK